MLEPTNLPMTMRRMGIPMEMRSSTDMRLLLDQDRRAVGENL